MRLLLISCFCFFLLSATAQEEAPKNWSLGGYVKNLQGLFFFNRSFPDPRTFRLVDTFLMDHLIHQRLNFRYFGGEHIRFTAELRSRIFYGDLVRLNPDFGRQVGDANDDFFDLSLTLLDESAWLIHTMLDRLYVEYISGDWELRLGRQRINWGIGSVWNPNDIFNAFSFTDFDYEERPGTDALRVRYYTGFASSLELAVRVADRLDETTIAGLWKFHRGNYDFQLLSGYDRGHWALGGGWAGSIKKAGFKGEATYFFGLREDRIPSFAATFGLDYSLPSSLYLNLGYLYNGRGGSGRGAGQIFEFELSAQNLYPYRHALFFQLAYPFTPLINGGMAIIYSPVEVHPLFLNPTLTISVAQNWDLDFIAQLVFDGTAAYRSPVQVFFLRLKYSF